MIQQNQDDLKRAKGQKHKEQTNAKFKSMKTQGTKSTSIPRGQTEKH